MSDLLYPKATDKHDDQILKFINWLRYEVCPGPQFTFVYASYKHKGGGYGDPLPHTKIPQQYFLHVCHFLWRYYLFARMPVEKVPLKLDKSFVAFLRKMLVMLDTALEQIILCCLQVGDGQLEVDQRFPLFDIYLTTEFVIGHHDPKSVDLWCKHHGAKDLERMDPFRFGT